MSVINVKLKRDLYPILIDSGQKAFSQIWKKKIGRPSCVLLITSQALHQCGQVKNMERLLRQLSKHVYTYTIPNGEKYKNINQLDRIVRFAIQKGLDRKSVIVGLGGGVVTDMAGFAASVYMRGLKYVSIPTTLLGMVDAAIGGKTGIDLPEGKNLMGTFWQPTCVYIHSPFLKTLSKRDWKTGFAEIIKYGVIWDARFFRWLENRIEKNNEPWSWSQKDIQHIIGVSARCKAIVVSRDVHETPLKGGREILNFGHTIGHALEAATQYKTLTHGESIAIGMVAAGRLALKKNMWSKQSQSQLVQLFSRVRLPTNVPRMTMIQKKRFWSALFSDKKNIDGKLRFVLPVKIGKVRVVSGIPRDGVNQILFMSKID